MERNKEISSEAATIPVYKQSAEHAIEHDELPAYRKFRNFWGSTEAVWKLSDLACMEHRLSVIENPKPHGKSYNKWMGGNAKPCQRDLPRAAIDAALTQKPKDFAAFLKLVEAAGYTVKRSKNVTFMRDGQPQNIRLPVAGRRLFGRRAAGCYSGHAGAYAAQEKDVFFQSSEADAAFTDRSQN